MGGKTSLLLNQQDNEQEVIYGVLGGAGVDVTQWLRLEANGGYFYRGVNPITAVLGTPVVTYGVSGQAAIHSGVPVGRSGDFPLYRNDPSSLARLVRPEEYPGGLSWLVSLEGTFTQTTLQDPDPAKADATTRQSAVAADLNVRGQVEQLPHPRRSRLRRHLPYLLINVPSFVPFQALSPDLSTTTPQMFAAAGVDYFFEKQRLTLGVTLGIENPATFTGKLPGSFVNGLPSDALPLSSTVVVRSDGLFDILKAGDGAQPIFAAKVNATLGFTYFNIVLDLLAGLRLEHHAPRAHQQ